MTASRDADVHLLPGYGITEKRLFGAEHHEWMLYVSDHYWVLDMDEELEVYYHPDRLMGIIWKKSIPSVVYEQLRKYCVVFDSHGGRFWHGKQLPCGERPADPLRSDVDFRRLEDTLELGNWFYAQGYNFVTAFNRFYEICFPYDSVGREWYLWDMKLYDMVRMTCSTRTHHFITTMWDLEFLKGVDRHELTARVF